jgi:uncharacterized protein YwqG
MTPEDLDALIRSKQKPGIVLQRTPRQTDEGAPGCWLGGEPTLPPEIEWPVFNPKKFLGDDIAIPMHFFAQINLAHLPDVPGLPEIPRKGTLFIFYDPAVAFGPEAVGTDSLRTGAGARLIYVDGDVSQIPRRTVPEMPELDLEDDCLVSPVYEGSTGFEFWPFEFVVVETWPEYSNDPLINGYPREGDDSLSISHRVDELRRQQIAELDALAGGHRHLNTKDYSVSPQFMFGASRLQRFPSYAFASHGPSELSDDHVLLLTLDGDPEIGQWFFNDVRWGFWIPRGDLKTANFENVSVWEDRW